MDAENPININITKNNEPQEKYNNFKEYIIINNVELQNEIRNLKDTNIELSKEISVKETEEDKTDASIRYLRGLVSNLNEIKKGYIDITNEKEITSNNINIILEKKEKINYSCYFELLLYNIIFVGENIIIKFISYNKFHYIIGLTLNIITNYIISKTYIDNYNKNNNYKKEIHTLKEASRQKIKELETDVLKLEESTLALDNWIYEV